MADTRRPVSSATWPRELYNQMASLERFAFRSVPRVHTSRFPSTRRQTTHPHRNRDTYSSPSDPPALSRILSSIRGILFPPIIVFPFIAINVNRGRSYIYMNIFTIRRYGEDRIVTYNERRREETRRLGVTVFIIAGG